LTEIFVSLSDLLIALECALFALLIFGNAPRGNLQAWVAVFFASAALAALLGGLAHGFFTDESAPSYRVLWRATMLAIGLSGLTAYVLTIRVLDLCKSWVLLAVMAYLVYVWDVFFISDNFRAAVAFYLPATILLLIAFLLRYIRQRQGAALLGAAATAVGLAGAFVQQSGWDLHPIYLDHNTVYHLIQAVSFFGLYSAFRAITASTQ